MGKRLRLLLTAALTLVLAVSLRNDFLYFLLGFEVLLWLVCRLQTFWIARKVRMTLELPAGMVFRGQELPVLARLENTGFLPVPQVSLRLAVRPYPSWEEILLRGRVMLDSGERGSVCFTLDGSHCALLEFRADRLIVSDLLGLTQRRCRIEGDVRLPVYVLPHCLASPDSVHPQGGSLAEGLGEQAHRQASSGETAEVRDYLPGDPMRLIHWKLSARLDRYIVRVMHESGRTLPLIWLDLRDPSGSLRTDPDAWDNFMETAAGASMSFLQEELPHRVGWLDADVRSPVYHQVSDEQSLQAMLCALLRAPALPAGDALTKEIPLHEEEYIEIDLQGVLKCTQSP